MILALSISPREHGAVVAIQAVGRVVGKLTQAGTWQKHISDAINACGNNIAGCVMAAPNGNFFKRGVLAQRFEGLLRGSRCRQQQDHYQIFHLNVLLILTWCGFGVLSSLGEVSGAAR